MDLRARCLRNYLLLTAIPRARLTIETIFVILKRKLLCDEKNSLLKTRKTNFILEI